MRCLQVMIRDLAMNTCGSIQSISLIECLINPTTTPVQCISKMIRDPAFLSDVILRPVFKVISSYIYV
jgi:hypothetical protein